MKESWVAAAAQFFSGWDVEDNLRICTSWMRKAKEQGADLVVLPENSNRDRDFFVDGKPCKDKAFACCEALDGDFVRGLQAASKALGIWTCAGVDLKGAASPIVYIGQVLINPSGEIVGVHKKHILWDYEYTLFEPGSEPYQVFDTELGRLAMLVCADGIVPECPRVLGLMGAQVFLNSLNSRGPDEMRVHIPLRSIENHVWHVASNTVGNPKTEGLLWPWTGGSSIIDPTGKRLATASEEEDGLVVAEIRPAEADVKRTTWTADLYGCRRPELYEVMTRPVHGDGAAPVAAMYGPAPEKLPFEGPETVTVAMMQLSHVHTRKCTEWMTKRQINYAKRRGATLGVLPELWCFRRGEVQADAAEAAAYSAQVLELMLAAAAEDQLYVCFSLVEAAEDRLYHTAYLVGPEGVVGKYRKAHLSDAERHWATPGDTLCPVFSLPALGRVAMMIGTELWIPEVGRCLGLEGVELVLHPTDWDRTEAAELAATERAGESRFHLVSVTRLDCLGRIGSQTTKAGEYIRGEPIPLMRYSEGVWARYNVEEQIHVQLRRREPHCKMMGEILDVVEKRFPELCGIITCPKSKLRSGA